MCIFYLVSHLVVILRSRKKISSASEILSELYHIHNVDGKEIPSVTTIANNISEHIMSNGESVPVGFIHSDFGACLPGSDYWPPNAIFGVFFPGL